MKSMADRKRGAKKRILVIGDSGTGKTQLLSTIGTDILIADFDNGLDALSGKPGIYYEEFQDGAGEQVTAWARFKRLVQDWRLKPMYPALALDSLTMAADAALRYVLAKNGRSSDKIQIADWGQAINEVKDMLGYLTTLDSHVIVTAHYQMVKDEELGGTYFVPLLYGKDLPPRTPMYFNDVYRTSVKTSLKGEVEYKLQVRPSTKYSTLKNSLGVEATEVEPNLAKLIGGK